MSPSELSRRAFLRSMSAVTLMAGCNRNPFNAADFTRLDRSPVALLAASSYEIELADIVRRGLELLNFNVQGKRILLKPNLVEYEADKAINTNPRIVAAAAQAFLSAGADRVVIGEGPGHRRDLEYLLGGTGMDYVLRHDRLTFVDLNHDDVRLTPLKSRFTGLSSLWLPETLLAADVVVTMPKLKTHHWAGMTASMKNLFGVVPGAVYGWPKNLLHFKGIEQSIVDLTATIRPHLSIVDGIVGMEGDGPIMGRPKPVGVLVMGTDMPAVDATCARLIGLDPEKMPYLTVSGAFIGNIDVERIDQRAESVSRFRSLFDVIEPIQRLRL